MSQGLDTVHKQRVAEVLSEPEAREKQRSRESLTSDMVKYESGPDGGEEVSMSVEWNGVSAVQSPGLAAGPHNSCNTLLITLNHCCVGSSSGIKPNCGFDPSFPAFLLPSFNQTN